ncbi:succinate dehydrogenase, cytochrome b556 subunit [Pusillimonas sp. TS35]|uniref:succinate dehydrogenase, cytochrome b556 subunit n=1 Tax=Paracandidimonas lactea TaxID=2895524 RepID=UPI001368EB98|nr:succinate dehydrogenase, cytochrome b556 subunit [Paracandidimonas lactea]MYN12356.1 succinate dehydrogenase, cytochrome b556 subunit [Pusillimonas sp. TS35]
MKTNDMRARRHTSWVAFAVHRVSGLLLTLFLPVHFWTLSLALKGEAALDNALRWYQAPAYKFGEWALVLLLTVHALGGIRILLLEFKPWQGARKNLVRMAFGAAAAVSAVFVVAMLM